MPSGHFPMTPMRADHSIGDGQVREDGPGGAFLLFTEQSGLMRTLPFAALAAPTPATPHPLLSGVQGGAGPAPPPAPPAARAFGAQTGKGGHLATMHHAMRCALPARPAAGCTWKSGNVSVVMQCACSMELSRHCEVHCLTV